MSYPRGTIVRNTTAARINHWITAACFVLLMLSGLSLLIPTAADLIGLARALLTGLVLWGCGRWAVRDAAPEVQIVAGWGAACLALTVWGALLPLSLAIPGVAVVAAGGAGLALRRPAAAGSAATCRSRMP